MNRRLGPYRYPVRIAAQASPRANTVAMATAQLVLGCLLLISGAFIAFGRKRIDAYHRRAGRTPNEIPALWIFVGTVMMINGVLQKLVSHCLLERDDCARVTARRRAA